MRSTIFPIVAGFLLLFTPPLHAQSAAPPDDLEAVRAELESLRKSQEAMQKDLQEIKTLLRARAAGAPRPAPADMKVSLANEPVRGASSATVVLVEYSDYQCPYCQRVAKDTMPQIDADYVATGKIRHVFKDLPLESLHVNAFRAAVAASCAGEQGKYWEYQRVLFENGKELSSDQLPRYAHAVGLDPETFTRCIASNRFDAAIRADMREANAADITGTPAFLIGTVDAKGQLTVVKALSGAQTAAAFKTALDEVLARKQ